MSTERRVVTINNEQELYVIPSGTGYTCLGFDYAYQTAVKVAQWANIAAPDANLKGTIHGYNEYLAIICTAGEHANNTKTRCNALLASQLIGHEGERVEVVDVYGETRRFIVGKSTGWLPIHLEIKQRNSTGGGGVTGTPFKSVRVVK